MEILALEDLSFRYPGCTENAVDGVSLTVREGEFLLLCGRSGCGKTTLLKLIKRELAPHGELSGNILFRSRPLDSLTDQESAQKIGYVLQSPEAQIVTDKVWHELAFGLESLGCDSDSIRLRVGEMANYFGIDGWFRSGTADLSGGQKQLLNLASVMAMSPELLILDEPTSQLDPIAAQNFIATLSKINRELGTTVIIAEHRLEELFPTADRVAVMDGGRIVACDAPRRVCRDMRSSEIFAGFPSAARIAAGLGADTDDLPITVREGRQFLSAFPHKKAAEKEPAFSHEPALTMKNVWFRYERSAPDILRGTTLEIMRGEIFSVLGGNGSGKTTLLRTVSGTERAYRGKTFIFGKNIKEMKQTELHRRNVAMLPQNVQTVFLKDSVRADLTDICRVMGCTGQDAERAVDDIAERLGISALLDRHPYDLSGGEMQKSALAKILLTSPRLLLLDEPTKGIDAYAKENLGEILRGLRDDGITVVIVTHDVEFAASYSDRCGLFFDGELLSPSCPQKFFGGNDFYTTAACRMSRGIFDGAVTVGDVTALGREGKDEV